MLRSNTQSCTPNGGRTLQTFVLMAYTRLGSCGEQQDKPGSRSCSLRYQPFLAVFFRVCSCCLLHSGFWHIFSTGWKLLGGHAQIYFACTHLHSTRSPSWEASPTCFSFPPISNFVRSIGSWKPRSVHRNLSTIFVFSFPQMASKQCRFRAIDVNNGGMCVFTVNKQGEAMLQALNMTAHMYSDHTYQY